MDVDQLLALLITADNHSLSAAASRLFVNQTTISRRIHALESETGAQLIQRHPHGIALTEQGHRFLPYARTIVQTLREAQSVLTHNREECSRTLAIGATPSLGVYVVPDLVSQLLRFFPDHPGITIRISTESLKEWLNGNALDIALSRCPLLLREGNFHCEGIYHEPIVLVTQPSHPLGRLSSVSMTDLAPWPFVCSHYHSSFWQTIDRFFTQHGLKVRVNVDTDIMDGLTILLNASDAVAALPLSAVAQHLKHGQLITLKICDAELPSSTVYVTYSSDTARPDLQKFLTLLSSVKIGDDTRYGIRDHQ